jgi:tetratricopeptide (TPR) repeat protein
LIQTIAKRYPKSQDEDAQPYYQAYADALKSAYHLYPDDLDLAAMTAEALMDMHPWDLWEKNGQPKPWTPEIIQIIEGILAKNPRHPQALHLYIHATEASDNPEKAIPYAKTLERLVPGSGHLVHMPSHTYINTGHYHEGTLANERAVKIDSLYVETCHEGGVYPLAYYPHNWHFLAACAALEGRGRRALEASRYMADHVVDKEIMYDLSMATLQHFYTIPWYIMVKFAMWDDLLKEKQPDPTVPLPTAIWNYARGMAHANKGNFSEAEAALRTVQMLESDTTLAKITIWDINQASDLVRIAALVLEGEISFRKGNLNKAIELLQKAVEVEDQLNYNEPPDWFFSVRHPLGHVLLKAGKYKEAEAVYRKDLEEYKENGWALIGLYHSLKNQPGKAADAAKVLARYKKAWQWADKSLESSVL